MSEQPEDENLMTDLFERVDYIEDRPIKDWREVKATGESEDEPDDDDVDKDEGDDIDPDAVEDDDDEAQGGVVDDDDPED